MRTLLARPPLLVLGGCALAALVYGATPRSPAGNGAIEQPMQQMNAALKALSKPITAETRAAALEELAKFETAALAAKTQVPESAAKVDEKKRAAFVADYRKTMVETLKLACDAEVAVLDGKYKDAETLIRNKLGAQKSAGHGKFKDEGK